MYHQRKKPNSLKFITPPKESLSAYSLLSPESAEDPTPGGCVGPLNTRLTVEYKYLCKFTSYPSTLISYNRANMSIEIRDKPEVEELEDRQSSEFSQSIKDVSKDAPLVNSLPTITEELRKNLEVPEILADYSEEDLEELDKRATRKIDMRMLPMLVYIYILNYLDRNNIASARLGGLEEDLGLKGSQYQTCISILFVGYILMQVPANMIFNKVGRPSLFITVIMTSWAIVSTSTGAVQGFGGLFAVRFILGFTEAGFFGSALLLLSCWYTRKQLSFRNAILYSGSLLSGAVSGLIATGIIQKMDGVGGLRSWRYLFLIEGSITILSIPFAYFILPDLPQNSKFLTEEERAYIMWKLRKEIGQDDDDSETQESYWTMFLLAIRDIKVLTLTGILSFLVAACGVTNFFPSVVQTLNFDRMTTLALTAPPYLLAVVFTYIWARHADKTGERFLHVVIPLSLALVSFIIAVSTTNTGARYFSMCLMIPSLYCAFTTILSWISNCVPRPPLKRAIAISIANCLSNSTSIWNSYLYPSSAAPRYSLAFICNCVFIVCSIALAVVLRTRLTILNNRIEEGSMKWEKELGKGNDGSKIHPDFRYLV